jgi:DNA invertase Pin-like site-specific DNA recombinase
MAASATPLRVLGILRLSNETDESTSFDRQRALIANWAKANGHVMAGWSEDMDVSGAIRPFARPELGPWLATPERFDVLAVWKLDRLTRRAAHFVEVRDWAEEHGKAIVSVTEGFDLSTPMGRMFATIISAFAEGELEMIRERTRGAHAKMRQDGRYAGAPWPMAYMPVDRPGGGKTLAPEPEYAPILRRIIRDVTEGLATAEIARRLNAEKIRTWGDRRAELRGETVDEPQRWTADVVQQIVRNPSCAGYKVQKNKSRDGRYLRGAQIVYDDDGNPVMATETPVVTPAEWMAAKMAMSSRATRKEPAPRGDSMLQGVLLCGSCGKNMYHHVANKKIKSGPVTYAYYRCQTERRQSVCEHPVAVKVDDAERQVGEALMFILGSSEITLTQHDPGEDYSGEIAEARARLDELEDDFLAGKYTGDEAKRRYERMHARACERIDHLQALPVRPAASRSVGTGETYAMRWERCDRLERRAFLLEQGFVVKAHAKGTLPHPVTGVLNDAPTVVLDIPERLWGAAGMPRFTIPPGTRLG